MKKNIDKQLVLKDIALVGRTFDEYYRMFDLNDELLKKEVFLDVASGVSSFCAEACAKGYDVTASDKIYTSDPSEIEKKCAEDLDIVMKQLPGIADLYLWNYFKDMKALKNNSEKAYRSFIEDFRKYGIKRYIPAEFPATKFLNGQFTISLASHFYLYTKTDWIMNSTKRRSLSF